MGESGKKILPSGGVLWGRHSNAEGFRIQMGSGCSKCRAVTTRLETRIPYHATERQVIIMFMGQYDHSIDAKGRIIIPAKYREDLGETFVVTRGLDGCLFLYPQTEWQIFVDKLKVLPSSQNTRKIQRQFLSKAMEVVTDKQGRILIPSMLREAAALDKEVVFVGMMNRVEVWDKSRLEAQELEQDEEVLEAAMDELDISL